MVNLRIFEIVILNTKWKDCKSRKNLRTKNFTYMKFITIIAIEQINPHCAEWKMCFFMFFKALNAVFWKVHSFLLFLKKINKNNCNNFLILNIVFPGETKFNLEKTWSFFCLVVFFEKTRFFYFKQNPIIQYNHIKWNNSF